METTLVDRAELEAWLPACASQLYAYTDLYNKNKTQ